MSGYEAVRVWHHLSRALRFEPPFLTKPAKGSFRSETWERVLDSEVEESKSRCRTERIGVALLKMGSLKRGSLGPGRTLVLGEVRRKTVSLSVRWSPPLVGRTTGSERGRTVATGGEETGTGSTVGDGVSASLLLPLLLPGREADPTSRFSMMRLTDPLSTRVATALGLISLILVETKPDVELESKVDRERKSSRGRTEEPARSDVPAETAAAAGLDGLLGGAPSFSRRLRFSSKTFSILAKVSSLKSLATRTVVSKSYGRKTNIII